MADMQRIVAFAVPTLLVLIIVAIPPLIALVHRLPERRTTDKLAPLSALSFVL